MSDEFIKIATNEIHDDISQISHILESCKSDIDVRLNAVHFQRHTHKIKGLAPMMGKEELGNLTALLDELFKKSIRGAHFDGVFDVLLTIMPAMKDSVIEPTYDMRSIIDQVKNILSKD